MLKALLVLLILAQHLPNFKVSPLVVLVLDHVVLPIELLQREVLGETIQLVDVHFEVALRRLVGPVGDLALEKLREFIGLSHFDEHLVLVLVLALADGELKEAVHFLLFLFGSLEVVL